MKEIKIFRRNNSKVIKLNNYTLEKNKQRAHSCIQSSHTLKNFKYLKRENIPAHLDVINLILKNSPQRVDMSLVAQKVNSLKKKYKDTPFDYSINNKFYEYNVIYGYKSNNIIKTYTPKLVQLSPTAKNKINLKVSQNIQVFTENEIIELFNQKCKDLDVPIKEELMNRFLSYIKEKCVNRKIDLTDCNLGFNSMIILSEILYRNHDICSRLNLTKNNFGDSGIELLIEKIRNNSNIIELNLCSNNIGVKGGIIIFDYLLNQNSIISLDLSSKEGIYRNRICSEGVKLIEKVLRTNFYLEKIDLSSNSLKNEGMKYLVKGLELNSSLQILIISNNEINDKGIIYMESNLKSCKLKHLDISCNQISNNGLILIGDCIYEKKLGELTYLNISDCSITFDSFRIFIKKLSKNHKIQTLIFSKNNLYSNKWESLENLFSSMSLKNLSLDSCHLGPAMNEVAHVFMRNSTIRFLDLSHNQINDQQFENFQEYPVNNLSLEEIDFSQNFISDKSATKFFKNLMFSSNFKRLNFFDNQLQNESAVAIMETLKNNHNIFHINIKCNRIGIKMMKEIRALIINNKINEKGKYLPKLKDELKGLEFNPLEVDNLRNKFIRSEKERENLTKKFSQEMKEFAFRKQKNIEEAKKVDDEFIEIQKENKKFERRIKNINEEKNNENDFFNKNLKIMKEKIFLIEKEIKEIKYKQNIIKGNQDEEIKLLKDTYENTLNKEQQILISISTLSKHLNLLKEKYEKKLDYLNKLKNAKEQENVRKETVRKRTESRKFQKNNMKKRKDSLNSIPTRKQKENNNEEVNPMVSNFVKKKSQSISIKEKNK